jgi:LPS sulfotransferase NodH
MKHSNSYIICATPRSGSTLLCDTRVAGRPNSFFRRQSFRHWADRWNVSVEGWVDESSFDRPYLVEALRHGADGTAVFGMRLMWESLGDLTSRLASFYPDLPGDSALFRSAFGPTVYVHLSREDKVAQAVSRLKAEQTGLWHVDADGTERERIKPGQAPVYDADAIAGQVAELQAHDAAWSHWFDSQGILPVRITYEMLSSKPQTVLATVLSALGLDPAIARTVAPRTAKLSDSVSREWAARYRSELAGPPT